MKELSAAKALELLRKGNERFVSGERNEEAGRYSFSRDELVDGQKPFAIIVGCSDSRVPAELVFDQGLGSLFVIRVAGNVVAPSQIGSVEFAAQRFGSQLVVVLGHTQCGAVSTTIEELKSPHENRSPNFHAIVDRIRPAVEPLLQTDLRNNLKELNTQAIRANIKLAANHLKDGSVIIEKMIAEKRLEIVCAEYALETGIVTFFEKDAFGG